MNARLEAVKNIGKRARAIPESSQIKHSAGFLSRVFHRRLIEKLPVHAAENWLDALDGKSKIDPEHADTIAEALKNWAMKHGATHYTHWFLPLSNSCAEKHDSFLEWGPKGTVLETLRGKNLLMGEPDASSFPSGGLRATHAARGYTAWDPTSFPFLWEAGEGLTLCIPAVFFSWRGDALDTKIPLMRSEEKLNTVVNRLFKLSKVKEERIFSTLGPEQEYFVVDRSLFLLRPDLVLSGRTVFGAKPPKGQEMEDHYFGPVKDRVIAFMREFEDRALRLGIPVKTRHNEVSPAQYEVAPLFERASLASEHNVMLMELMRQVASKHDLACLFHEKPFEGVNGSGKHNNWSIVTESGKNLLDPEEDSLIFLTLLTAILSAVKEGAGLLRASIGSLGNDRRLGGSEAPPTILSIFLGEVLEKIVEGLMHEKKEAISLSSIDLGLKSIPKCLKDASDRNRTSFFAFTGNKFEFRAVGASASCALPITCINALVADSLELILDEIQDSIGDRDLEGHALFAQALPVLQMHLMASQPVFFSGNNYSSEWAKEAEERGLLNIKNSLIAFSQFLEKKAIRAFEGILSTEELQSRYEVMVQQYAKLLHIETNLMIELFQTQVLPTAQKDFRQRGIQEPLLEAATAIVEEMKQLQEQSSEMGWQAKAKVYSELILPRMDALRRSVDKLEMLVDNSLWPLPKYRELLFLV